MIDAFDPYVSELERLAAGKADPAAIAPHLDGEVGRRLRSVVEIDDLRQAGAFFTGEELARRMVAFVPASVDTFADPAAGCGDLLLAACERLPLTETLEETLRSWNERLYARDIVPQFIRAARARVALAAIARGARPNGSVRHPLELLTNIAVGDGQELVAPRDSAILLNPPYGRIAAPADCSWSSGLTTQAGLFLDKLLDHVENGTYVVALLPEVIRAGARYGALRREIEQRLSIEAIDPAGVFDALTDVDVFVLAGRATADPNQTAPSWTVPTGERSLGDLCTVGVGPVVANRDPKRGPRRPFVDARGRGTDAEVTPTKMRRFGGPVIKPPFVVVGRTNRPASGSTPRLRGTIVRGTEPVAVENHLLTLVPHDRTVRGCRELVTILQSDTATKFLDARLRCRHLTVGAVRDIPR